VTGDAFVGSRGHRLPDPFPDPPEPRDPEPFDRPPCPPESSPGSIPVPWSSAVRFPLELEALVDELRREFEAGPSEVESSEVESSEVRRPDRVVESSVVAPRAVDEAVLRADGASSELVVGRIEAPAGTIAGTRWLKVALPATPTTAGTTATAAAANNRAVRRIGVLLGRGSAIGCTSVLPLRRLQRLSDHGSRTLEPAHGAFFAGAPVSG
jgi:hypothetical protein